MADPTIQSDEELVRSAQRGALEAFTDLYERYLPAVYGRVRCVIPEEDVEDVTQEVFIAVMRSLKSFRYEARFATWLRTLVRRQIADYYRNREPKALYLVDKDDMAENGDKSDQVLEPGDGADLEAYDDVMILRQALQRLPENYQEILVLRFVEGLRFDEIAQLHDQSLEATKSLFRRAVAALQKRVTCV